MHSLGSAVSRLRRLGAVPLLAGVAILAFAVPSLAAGSWHPISGTCYESGDWYTSSNTRYVSSGGSAIKAKFNTTPSKGMAFRVINKNTGSQMGVVIYSPPLYAQQIVGTKPAGTPFVNSFKLQVAGHQDSYSFDGSELY